MHCLKLRHFTIMSNFVVSEAVQCSDITLLEEYKPGA